MSYEKKFAELPDLPPNPTVQPGCNYIPYRIVGDMLYLAGNGPVWGNTIPPKYVGKVGKEITTAHGADAAKLTAMNLLLTVRQALGTLDKVDYIVSVDGAVNCTDSYTAQPTVIDGCSDLLVEIFGEHGKHTRTAAGTNSLAFGICVEISMTLKIK